MKKRNILFLCLIVIVAIALRVWNLDTSTINNDAFNLNIPNDFFAFFFTNATGIIHSFYLKIYSILNLDKILPYASILLDAISIITLYFLGQEFNDKKNAELTGLISSGFGAISVFLISTAKNNSLYSLVFLLASLVILFAFKILNTQNKKYFIPLSIFSIMLFFTFNLSVFFIIFSFLAIISFYAKKKKTLSSNITTFFGILLLFSPIIPFVLNVVNTPDYLNQYALSFNFEHIIIYLTNMFSPKLSLTNIFEFSNVGFWIFVIIPSIIGFTLAVIGTANKKTTSYCVITLFISTFLSMLIMCICAKEALLSKYLITVYPILIVAFANGIPSLKSKTLKIILPTIFATITLFYIIANNLISTKLF
ncbi:MAG: hypothetical protein E7Z91_00670 [Cyanobacteria bacterium SIG30]|nr:hypothetical protein [Cyanobacteria bacterium SIG30]